MSSKHNKRLTLASVIVKVRSIADSHYDGKVYDNVLAIFNQLTSVERRILLKGLINICFTIEDKILDEVTFHDGFRDNHRNHSREKQRDVAEFDDDNQRELVGLKSWSFKFAASLMVGLLIAFVIGSYFISEDNGLLPYIQKLVNIIKIAFDL